MTPPGVGKTYPCLFICVIALWFSGCSASSEPVNAKRPSLYPPRDHIHPAKGGVTDDDIEAVLEQSSYSESYDSGGTMYSSVSGTVYVLYKNGIGCYAPSENLIEVSLAQVTAEEDECFQWQPYEDRYQIKWPGEDWEVPNWTLYNRGTQDDRLHRTVRNFVSIAGASASTYLHFFRSGTFEQSNSSMRLFTTHTPTGSVYGRFSSYSDKSGSESSAMVSGFGPANSSLADTKKAQSANPGMSGEYYIDGYTIEMIKDAGTRERRILAFGWDRAEMLVDEDDYGFEYPGYLKVMKGISKRLTTRRVQQDDTFYLTLSGIKAGDVKLFPLGSEDIKSGAFKAWMQESVQNELEKLGRSTKELASMSDPRLPGVGVFFLPPSGRSPEHPLTCFMAFLSKQDRAYLFRLDAKTEALLKEYLPVLSYDGIQLMK